jgi:DNA invertase Pin-like site-specific DNA recombinase
MAKELPYFRFTVQDWQNGKISLESFELQGLFISICGYYWINDCSLTLAMLHKKFSNAKDLIKELIDLQIIKYEIKHDKVEIEFLNIQYDLLSENRKARQSAGSKGGKAKAMLKQKPSYKDKDKDNNKDNNKDKDKDISINDIKLYFFENGYSEITAQKFFDYYSVASWKDSKGNKVKNWKQKAQSVWFKDENKIKDTNSPLKMVY